MSTYNQRERERAVITSMSPVVLVLENKTQTNASNDTENPSLGNQRVDLFLPGHYMALVYRLNGFKSSVTSA
jgi:hypothetical protein